MAAGGCGLQEVQDGASEARVKGDQVKVGKEEELQGMLTKEDGGGFFVGHERWETGVLKYTLKGNRRK